MSLEKIEAAFQEKVGCKVRLMSEGLDRYRVFTPFLFEDGDHLSIVFKRDNGNWILSDEGHTYMHLTYDLEEKDLQRGTRQKIINNTISVFHIRDREGELFLRVEKESYGDALYAFVQALLKITDVTFLSRERVHSAFMDDFRAFISERVPKDRRTFDWHDFQHDPQGIYSVNCRINHLTRPLMVFALPNDDHTRDATIAVLQFEKWGIPFRSLAIFEDQEIITRKVLARFSDVFEKQFSSLGDKDRIHRFLKEAMQG